MNEEDFQLSNEERHSPVWARLREHLEQRLQSLRQRNDTDLTLEQTAKLRGRIADTQYVLSLGVANRDLPEPLTGHDE